VGELVGVEELSVELLGPVRVRQGGAYLDVGGPKQLAVLAVLALSTGREVTPAGLAAALWGDDAPPSAGGTLRAYVSRLRSQLPDGVLQRSSGGWRLQLDRGCVDALRARDLLAQAAGAGVEAERELIEQALGLWRDRPLRGLGAVPFAAAEVERLQDLEAGARERLLELRLVAGETREVLAEAGELVARFPHREAAVAHLAVALARCGRSADALAAVEGLRERLADELGLDLSPALVDLQRRLLVHDPSVAPAVSVPGRPGHGSSSAACRGRPLPLPLTSFVGREADIPAVHGALDVARLVTLVGPGGAGKTRLALEALRRLDRQDLDGPWLVELAHVTRPELVPDSVAEALEVATPTRATSRLIAEAVRGRRMLLVLDNCEHVVAEVADLVTSLLSTCAGLQVLATSREPLGVPGERVVGVAPLPVGRQGAAGEAERLFVERAASVVPGFRLDPVTGPLVRRVVRALDGLPLAVELAAARLALLSLHDVVEMLDDRFSLLAGGSRTVRPQQRALGAAVQWSYDLLDDQERLLFGIASAFDGPFELAALRGIAEPELERPVIGLLASLTAKSMVQVDRAVDPRRPRTYRLLETMRAFGRERLDPDLRERLAARHAAWFAGEADRAYLGLRGPDLQSWLVHLDTVRPDVRAALEHGITQSDRALPLRLVAGLSPYWFHRGHVQEGLDWTARVLQLPGSGSDVLESRAALGAALLAYGAGAAAQSDDGVLSALEAAVTRAPGADDSTAAVAFVYAGYFQAAFGALPAALAHFQQADDLLQTGRVEPWAVSEVLFAQGQLLRAQGRRVDALQVLERAARTAETCGHAWARGSARWIAAKVHLDLRQGAPALAALARELPSCIELGIHTSTLTLLHTAAGAAAAVERHAEGAVLLGAVDAWSERLGYSPVTMDPQDAGAHRALVREGLTEGELEQHTGRGRQVSLPDAVQKVVELAQQVVRVPVPRVSGRGGVEPRVPSSRGPGSAVPG
jgi:predicted ATPase/DNA-binding SARP family transcriptional activator